MIIYTGGTIGMLKHPETGVLYPVDFSQIEHQVPELKLFGFELKTMAFNPPVDSSNIEPVLWAKLAGIITEHYDQYHGFVILHGTDTMAYSASALSFMLQNLSKPVIFTGSQLPIGTLRTDGKENLISAIEIAAAMQNNKPIVPEVCIYFEYKLYRGNRTTKFNAEHFDAFRSNNYPLLAESGIDIKYNHAAIQHPQEDKPLKIYDKFDQNIAVLRLFPGMSKNYVQSVLDIKDIRAIIIETFGAGNAPDKKWFLDNLKEAVKNDIILYNVTQCRAGSVQMEKYETGIQLEKMGVISGRDITIEAAVTKLMFILGNHNDIKDVKMNLARCLNGEITLV